MDYYLIIKGEQLGPYSIEQVRKLWTSSEITANTLGWYEGIEDWQPIGTIAAIMQPALAVSTSLVSNELVVVPLAIPDNSDHRCQQTYRDEIKSEIEEGLTSWKDINWPAFMLGATSSSTSKIAMGIESIRRKDYNKALILFQTALEETHTVAAGWLGIGYAEAFLTCIDRRTLSEIRHAIAKARELCPLQERRIRDHHGTMLTLAMGVATIFTGLACHDYLKSIRAMQEHSKARRKAKNKRAISILLGSLWAVSGTRSKGSLWKTLNYGLAARRGFMAMEAHEVANQSQHAIFANLRDSRASFEIALDSESLTRQLIEEARQVRFGCNSAVQGIIDDQANKMLTMLERYQSELTAISASLTGNKFQGNERKPFIVRLLRVIFSIFIVLGIILVVCVIVLLALGLAVESPIK